MTGSCLVRPDAAQVGGGGAGAVRHRVVVAVRPYQSESSEPGHHSTDFNARFLALSIMFVRTVRPLSTTDT